MPADGATELYDTHQPAVYLAANAELIAMDWRVVPVEGAHKSICLPQFQGHSFQIVPPPCCVMIGQIRGGGAPAGAPPFRIHAGSLFQDKLNIPSSEAYQADSGRQ